MSATNAEDLKKFFKEAKERAQSLKSKIVAEAGLSDDQRKELQTRLQHMIEYSVSRHDWYDEQRNRFLQIGLALMAAAAAVAAVIIQIIARLPVFTAVLSCLCAVSAFGTGFLMVYLYNKGVARDHPYRKVADIRSWYFAYTFPSGLKDHLSSDPRLAKQEVSEVVDGLERFLNRWFELTKNNHGFLKEDLEQVFILQLLQRYRAQQVKLMSVRLYKGLFLTAILLILSLLSYGVSTVHNSRKPIIEPGSAYQQTSSEPCKDTMKARD